ncbi:MAG: hypothetical protein HY879_14125 [Deltaproteobacteria bacterium]|nr:hypothetical protein [Deltaproteobacteria bacterium]
MGIGFTSHRILFFFLSLLALLALWGCNVSDVNKKDSVSSGTTTGSGSSSGTAAMVTVTVGNNPIASGATTSLTVIVTDSQGRRTEATIILTSSRGGTFNGTDTTLSGSTFGGALIATYTAPSVSTQTDIELAAVVPGTTVRGTTILTVQ